MFEGLTLKRLTIDDRDIIMPYLYANKYGSSDFSFYNLFAWRNTHPVDFAIHKGFLVVLSSTFRARHFIMPVELGSGGNLAEVIGDMKGLAFASNMDFSMIGLTEPMLEQLAFMGPEFEVSDVMVWDYVYNTEDLITLRGKKFHAKRNHINKFNSLYDYEYQRMEAGHIPLCNELLVEWSESHGSSEWLDGDGRAVREALAHFDGLGALGGCLFVDGKLAAFTLGQPINSEVFCIHIEKALQQYEGIYAKINQLFAQDVCSEYKYINREEDMGIEGLRKSKMSYNPAYLLHKRKGLIKRLG